MFRLLFLFWLSFHPVHVSFTSLDYLPETGSFKGFVRIHSENFLLDCGCEVSQEALLADEKLSVSILEKYLNDKLTIIVNNKTIPGKVGTVEISDGEINIDIEYPLRRKPGTIIVRNLISTAIFTDQENMVIVKVNEFEEGVKLTSEVTEQTFKVN